jgi:ribosome-associated protein
LKLEKLPEEVRLAISAAQEKKAGAITVMDLSGIGAFTEYFVICTGFSSPQVQAICNEIEDKMEKQLSRSPEHREGRRSPDWALLDYGGFIVHVFGEQARRYYDLERLWRSAPHLVLADEPGVPASQTVSHASARHAQFGEPGELGEAYSK